MFTNNFSLNCVTALATLTVVLIAYLKWKFQYWQRRNVPTLPPKLPLGHEVNLFTTKEHPGLRMKHHYDEMKKKGWKHGGLYMLLGPGYIVIDLDYVKNVLTKDFQYFTDRIIFYDEETDPLSAHLFALKGQKWRPLRTKLTPTFTSGKMKIMFQTLIDCTPNLLSRIEKYSVEKIPVDIKEMLCCFTTDVIGSCAFGLDCNTFKEDNSPFREYGKKSLSVSATQIMKILLAMSFPKIAKLFKNIFIPRDVSDFFLRLVKDMIEYREKNKVTRNDFMQLMIELKNKPENEALTFKEIAAQCFVFFLAGFETSSTTMNFALYQLSKNPSIQEKLRKEVVTVLQKHGKMTYEALQEMKYMDQVIDETLRMYPPLTVLTRTCVKDYKIPDEDVIIERGTQVVIPVYAIHYDEEYYPDPTKFDPDRFSEENKNARHHYSHLPFGEGPRNCIGMRFGLMQTKVGLASLLKNYKFSVNEKTEEPLKMKVHDLVLGVDGCIWLNVEKI